MSATTPTPAQANGTAVKTNSQSWLQTPVQSFFGAFNWEDHAPEVQVLRQNALQGSDEPLRLTLNVQQFFGAINWEGQGVVTPPRSTEVAQSPTSPNNDLTLDDFSSLF
jgi:hypothetical protein